jgi:hypothetical protein
LIGDVEFGDSLQIEQLSKLGIIVGTMLQCSRQHANLVNLGFKKFLNPYSFSFVLKFTCDLGIACGLPLCV